MLILKNFSSMNTKATPVVVKIRNPIRNVRRIRTATPKRKLLRRLHCLNRTKMKKRHRKRNKTVQNEMQKGSYFKTCLGQILNSKIVSRSGESHSESESESSQKSSTGKDFEFIDDKDLVKEVES